MGDNYKKQNDVELSSWELELYRDDKAGLEAYIARKKAEQLKKQAEEEEKKRLAREKEEAEQKATEERARKEKEEAHKRELEEEKRRKKEEKAALEKQRRIAKQQEKARAKAEIQANAQTKKRKKSNETVSGKKQVGNNDIPGNVVSFNPAGEVQKPKKKKRNGTGLRIVGVIAALVLVALLGIIVVSSIIKNKNTSELESAYLTHGTIKTVSTGDAYIIRESEFLKAPCSGVVIPVVEEGDKVEAGGVVAYVVSSADVDIYDRISEINNMILTLQKLGDAAITRENSEALAEAEENIKELSGKLAGNGNCGLSEMSETEEELSSWIEKRDEILLEIDTKDLSIKSLQNEKAELETAISERRTAIKSESGGVVSYYVPEDRDDTEKENAVYDMIKAGYDALTFGWMEEFSEIKLTNTEKTEITTDKLACRIITSQEYYLLIAQKKDMTDIVGKNVTVTDDEKGYSATGTIKTQVKDGSKYYLLVSFMRGLKGSCPYETIDASFGIGETSGYMVARSAVVSWDEPMKTVGIAMNHGGYVRIVYMGVVEYDDENVIVSTETAFSKVKVYENGEIVEKTSSDTFSLTDKYYLDGSKVQEGDKI